MTDLLPCPFCGAESEVEEVGLGATNGVSFTVGCASKHEDACMGYQCFQTFALRKDAIEAWNKRAPQPVSVAQAEPDREGARLSNWLADYSHDLMEDGNCDQEAAEIAKAAQWIADALSPVSSTGAQGAQDAADAARYRHLKEHCSYYYHEGHNPPSPRELGIEWHWQDGTPERADMDTLIDREIEEKRVLAEVDADEGVSLASTGCGGGK